MRERLHYITSDHASLSHTDLCREACEAGAPLVQLRMKNATRDQVFEAALECRRITEHYNAKLIINDHLDIALETGADGVHLGLKDLDTAKARSSCPINFIIGGTANTLEDIVQHACNGVDYVGLGPLRFTATKAVLSPILGFEGYAAIMAELKAREIHLPVIAIGGIGLEDINTLRTLGLHGIAVSALITEAKNKRAVITELKENWEYGTVGNSR